MTGPWRRRFRRPSLAPADAVALVALAAISAYYLAGLTRYLINDDEGSYLYAAWRISRGELPYADFLTPQLPAFLFPGGLLMRLVGPSVAAARAAAATATLGAGAILYLMVRRLMGPMVALGAAVTLLVHPDVFLDLRTFRPDAFMLLAVVAGLGIFSVAALPRPGRRDPPRRWGLATAGLVFGVGALTKLFAPFVMAGCGLWLLADGRRGRRQWRAVAVDLVTLGAAAAIPVALGLGAFVVAGADVYGEVVMHHLGQGADLGLGAVVLKGVAFFRDYVRYHALESLVAVGAAVAVWRAGRRELGLFAWQLPTVLVLFGLSRELFGRHLVYTLPAVSTLFAWTAVGLARGRRGEFAWLGPVLVAALWGPWLLLDRDLAWRTEDGTTRLADFVDLVTEPDDIVLSDYSELNFYARRPTTYSAASLSAGAAASGQITWARIKAELDAQGHRPALLLVDRTELEGRGYGHLRFLRDLEEFEAWVATDYELAGTFVRRVKLPDRQVYAVYRPRGLRLAPVARFDGGPDMLAAGWPGQDAVVMPGDTLRVVSAWVADDVPYEELALTVRLRDGSGAEWAQADAGLMAAGARTTPSWSAGELTTQAVDLAVPPGLPPGRYQVWLGVYRRRGGGQLSPQGDAAAGEMVPVGEITVTAWRPRRGDLRKAAPELVAIGEGLGPVTLVGRGPLPDQVEAGREMVVDTWWRVEAPMGSPRLRLSLGDRAEGTVAADVQLAFGSPSAPPAGWPAGAVVRQRLAVPILAGAPGGPASLGAQVDDSETVILGTVMVAPRQGPVVTDVPPMDVEAQARFGEAMELVGASFAAPGPKGPGGGAPEGETPVAVTPGASMVPGGARGGTREGATSTLVVGPGADLAVDLVWRGLVAMSVRYKTSVQIIGPQGTPVAQDDSEPAGWTRPTTSWLPGEVIVDRHVLTVPPDLAPGAYGLAVVVYDAASGERLALAGGPAAPMDALVLAGLEVASGP